MAIAKMAKVIIASHRSEASELLEALQKAGICQILNAEEAAVTGELGDIEPGPRRPRDIEALLARIEKAIAFVKKYTQAPKGIAAALAPKTVIDEPEYQETVSSKKILQVVDRCESIENETEKIKVEIERLEAVIETIGPWVKLETAVEEMGKLNCATCRTGLIPVQNFAETLEKIDALGGALETVGSAGGKYACLIVSLNEVADEVGKALRSAEFDTVSFDGMKGKVEVIIAEQRAKLAVAHKQLAEKDDDAAALSDQFLKLKILFDHYNNLLAREQARDAAPATEKTVLLEGWVKISNYSRLEKIVAGFDASSLAKIEPAEGEDVPIEIDNKDSVRPFEAITRLYGMPMATSLDPTVFLAPFFMLFFGLCLTDAGYGIIMVALLWYFLKKMQGDKKFVWMLLLCSISTIVAGALTGGWFGDAVQAFLPGSGINTIRESIVLFDPMKQPMVFFALSLGLGYIQIMFGLVIALVHNLRRKDKVAAICDQVTWLVMLNSLILYGLAKGGIIPAALSIVFAILSIIPALTILLFSVRQGGWGERIGMGVFGLFCTVFYLGDVLSYVRIMALGMVTAGFGMAVNISVVLLADVPYVGWLLGAIVFVGGHTLNIALSGLGSFVHSMRLQFVEFFPKFFEGGGRQFLPLTKEHRHICVEKSKM